MASPRDYDLLVTRPIEAHEVAAAARVSAAAFHDSPAYVAIAPDAETRRAFLEWLFECNYWLQLGGDAARGVFRGEEMVMFYMLDARPAGAWDMVRAGLLRGAWRFGLGTMARLIRVKDAYDAARADAVGARDGLATLERVTVVPEFQGRGVGSGALRAALVETDAARRAVYLETQEARNVRFYERLGFHVVADRTMPGGWRNWTMVREPAAAAPDRPAPPRGRPEPPRRGFYLPRAGAGWAARPPRRRSGKTK